MLNDCSLALPFAADASLTLPPLSAARDARGYVKFKEDEDASSLVRCVYQDGGECRCSKKGDCVRGCQEDRPASLAG